MDFMLLRDSTSLLFTGSVSDKKGKLKNASIELQDFPTLNRNVDTSGRFSIMLPDSYEEDGVRALIKCKGYKTKDDRFELGKNQPLTLIKQ